MTLFFGCFPSSLYLFQISPPFFFFCVYNSFFFWSATLPSEALREGDKGTKRETRTKGKGERKRQRKERERKKKEREFSKKKKKGRPPKWIAHSPLNLLFSLLGFIFKKCLIDSDNNNSDKEEERKREEEKLEKCLIFVLFVINILLYYSHTRYTICKRELCIQIRGMIWGTRQMISWNLSFVSPT